MIQWHSPETAPKNGEVFIITTSGAQLDLCWWDGKCFRDYYHKQRLPQEWPYITAWMPMPDPAHVEDTESQSRKKNGFPRGCQEALQKK